MRFQKQNTQLTLPHSSMWAELKQRGIEAWKLKAGSEKHLFLPYWERLHSQHLQSLANPSMLQASVSYFMLRHRKLKIVEEVEIGREIACKD